MSKITIKDDVLISWVQGQFNELFPYLKIEFFKKPHGFGEGSPKDEMVQGDTTIGELRHNHVSGDVLITPDTKVGSLEDVFESQYGLHVQIFRKSGDLWLETTNSDDWTLAEQNDHARERAEFKEQQL